MGREASTYARIGAEHGAVMALLEAEGIILRGAMRRRYPRGDLATVRAEDGELRFECGGDAVALVLGEPAASQWAAAIRKPLPSLREKLGVRGPVLVIGNCDDAALRAALAESTTEDPVDAGMIVAGIDSERDLAAALAVPGRLPIWAVYRKGKGVLFGDAAIRQAMRAAGYRDSKSCAVSEQWTATRYNAAAS